VSTNGPSATTPTFVLGAGAQKAGTTWLYRYLKKSAEFRVGYRKEYHVFDTVDLASERWTRDRNLSLAEEALTSLRHGGPADAAVLHRMSMVADPAYYYDYFAGLLHGRGRGHVTADVTPAYALLPVKRFAEMRREFADRGISTVAVFLMRDPVDRIWSQIRMQRRRSGEVLEGTDEEFLVRTHMEHRYSSRSHYHLTIDALDTAFGEATHYEFYERLFSEEAVSALCSSVGIAMHPPEYDVRRNEAPAEVGLSEAAVREVAGHLTEVYQRVARRFPEVDLPALWPSARYVL